MTQQEALKVLKSGVNVFLTGAAGSGKTYLLNQYIADLKEQGIIVSVTASTGIAATHMEGVTIHSWSGIGIKDYISERDVAEITNNAKLRDKIKTTEVLIIDEISMLDSIKLDAVDAICRAARQSEVPFGGIQVILCGDFFQLPPINSRDGQLNFAFRSYSWSTMNIQVCYLEEQHRQDDQPFLNILNAIRSNTFDQEHYDLLEERYNTPIKSKIRATRLYTHNVDVDAVNNSELKKINSVEVVYEMTSEGKAKLVAPLKKSCLAPEVLVLKKGAVVMFVKNNFTKGYANGTLGIVIGFDEDNYPVIETFSGKKIVASAVSWSVEERGEVKAKIFQIPLRLAWAITVHKSQGMSLDAAEIDLSKSFVAGMGYVALSRVRKLSGIKLLGINNLALQVHPEIIEFDRQIRQGV